MPQQGRTKGSFPIVSSGGITGFHNHFRAKAPGVVTGRYGTIGDVFFLEEDYWPLNTSLWVKDFHGNNERFIFYLLTTVDFKKLSDKTGVPGINRNNVHKLNTLVPPLEEQRKIADILSTWDEAIEQQTHLIELKRERKRGLMQQLLTGKVRFKEFEGLEWETKSLGDIAVVSSGGTPTSTEPSYYGGGIPWVAIADITSSGKHISRTEKTITQRGLDESSAKMFPKGTLLFAMYASIGKCTIAAVDLSCNQAILGIRPFGTVSTEFLYYFLASQESQYSLMGQQGTQKNLNAGMVKGFDVPLPTLNE